MAQKAPGKAFRKGISLANRFKIFSTDEATEDWFVEQRWPLSPNPSKSMRPTWAGSGAT